MNHIKTFNHRNPVEICRQLGLRLKKHRLALGWTQSEVAERAGISLSTLKLMEREGKGSLQRLAKLAVVLQLDEDLRRLFTSLPTPGSIDDIDTPPRQRGRRRSGS